MVEAELDGGKEGTKGHTLLLAVCSSSLLEMEQGRSNGLRVALLLSGPDVLVSESLEKVGQAAFGSKGPKPKPVVVLPGIFFGSWVGPVGKMGRSIGNGLRGFVKRRGPIYGNLFKAQLLGRLSLLGIRRLDGCLFTA